jgi:hypothetical protein
MVSERSSQQAFFATSALLFAGSAALTIAWCGSMSAMGKMPMPGGWAMSMTWMRMPGQTWATAAASFLVMWVVMMVAMMLPSLAPMLWRYRQSVERTCETHRGRLTTLVGLGYFFVWTLFGLAVSWWAWRLQESRWSSRSSRELFPWWPDWSSSSQAPSSSQSGRYITLAAAARRRGGVAKGLAFRTPLRPQLCQPDGNPVDCRSHGPARDGRRYGRYHRRTSRTRR